MFFFIVKKMIQNKSIQENLGKLVRGRGKSEREQKRRDTRGKPDLLCWATNNQVIRK